MGKYIIKGGNKLNGEVFISGAKNAVLPILASTVLNSGICILKNVPMLLDTFVAMDILRDLGCKVTYGENTVVINSKDMNKTKEASISYPGGCNLGKRPIDFHLEAFKKLGIKIDDNQNLIKASVNEIKENTIDLPFASVGATQNIILASIFVRGKVVIKNCAKEPEIIDMVKFLRKMGANIYGEGTDTITIKGVEKLKDIVEYTVMPDRIEAGTFLCMSAITNGNIKVNGIAPHYLSSLTDILEQMGCEIIKNKESIKIKNIKNLKCIDFLETKPYPYFATDLQPQIMALLSTLDGISVIKENIFEARNKHIPELNKMGCNIVEDNNIFVINGVNSLTGKNVFAKDLRGGASLIMAGLFAEGETVVDGACYINRGYEYLDKKLSILGADIKYIED